MTNTIFLAVASGVSKFILANAPRAGRSASANAKYDDGDDDVEGAKNQRRTEFDTEISTCISKVISHWRMMIAKSSRSRIILGRLDTNHRPPVVDRTIDVNRPFTTARP